MSSSGVLKKPEIESFLSQTFTEVSVPDTVKQHESHLCHPPLCDKGAAVFCNTSSNDALIKYGCRDFILMGPSVIINRCTGEVSVVGNVLLYILSLNRPNKNKLIKINPTLWLRKGESS